MDMVNKSDISKKFWKIMFFLIFILIIILVIIGILNNKNKNRERDSEYVRPEVFTPMFSENFFSKYKGNVSKDDILMKLTDFVYYLVDNKVEIDQLNSSEISDKYLQNKDFFQQMGFSSLEDYTKIIKMIQDLPRKQLDLSYTSFEINSIQNKDDKLSVIFSVKFTDIDEIKFTLEIENTYKDDGIIHIYY